MSTQARILLAAAATLLTSCSASTTREGPSEHPRAITGSSPVKGTHGAVIGVGVVSGKQVAVRCTAVLIAPGAALTAAHCLSPPSALSLLIGDDASVPERTLAVREQIAHPLYVGDGGAPIGVAQANDLAVLLLEEPVTDIEPLRLPRLDDDAPEAGDEVELVGVGAAGPAGPNGPKRAATAQITAVGDFELRISKPGQPQACDGDSGGPALAEGVVLGLVSRAVVSSLVGCEDGAIYTRVDAYLDDGLIKDNVTLPCGSGSADPCGDGGARDGGASDSSASDSSASPAADLTPPIISVGTRGKPSPREEDDGCAISAPISGSLGPLLILLLIDLALRRRRRAR